MGQNLRTNPQKAPKSTAAAAASTYGNPDKREQAEHLCHPIMSPFISVTCQPLRWAPGALTVTCKHVFWPKTRSQILFQQCHSGVPRLWSKGQRSRLLFCHRQSLFYRQKHTWTVDPDLMGLDPTAHGVYMSTHARAEDKRGPETDRKCHRGTVLQEKVIKQFHAGAVKSRLWISRTRNQPISEHYRSYGLERD